MPLVCACTHALGSVRTSLSMLSWKPAPLFSLRSRMNCAMALFDWPSWSMEKLPKRHKGISSKKLGRTFLKLACAVR